MHAYAPNSPNCERWFALEHEEERRRGVHVDHDVPPPPPQVLPEEEEAAYQVSLEEAPHHALEVSRLEEDAHWAGLDQALALSAAGTPSTLRSVVQRSPTCGQASSASG